MTSNIKKYRLAIFVAQPIHYKLDLYKELNNHPDIEVMIYFGSDLGIRKALDKTFNRAVRWYERKNLKGLPHKFLKNYSFNKSAIPADNPLEGTINFGIIPELIKNRYDAILLDGYMQISHWLIFLTALVIGTPIIFRGESHLLNYRSRKINAVKKIILPLFFKKISAFLSIGSVNAKYFFHYKVPENKIFLAPYSVNNKFFKEKLKTLPTKERLRAEFGLNPEKITILYASKLIKRKRPEDLLKTYNHIIKKHKDIGNKIQLIFVGDGPELIKLENYKKENKLDDVYFFGFKSQEELPKFYALSDIFILPSSFETWGLVINEAMNFGLPIITTDMVGSSYDIVKIEENGFVYKTGDTDKLFEYLLKLIENKKLRNEMGKKSLEIIDKWSYKETISGILKAIKFAHGPRVIVAQPGSHHLYQTAIGLQKNNLLKYYNTGIYYKPDKFPYFLVNLLPEKLKNKIILELKRRRYEELDDLKVKTFGFYEWLYIINSRLIKSKKFHLWIMDKRNKNFSVKVGELAKKKAKILWSGMAGSLEAFVIAKQNNIKCILDQFSGHPAVLNKILNEELQKYPELKNIIQEKISPLQMKRLMKEMDLADIIVTGSNFAKKTLEENGIPESKIIVIPYGIDTKRFASKLKKPSDGIFRLLFVGNISIPKGCHYLLKTIKKIDKPDIKLTMIGRMENRYFLDNFGNYFNWIPSIPHSQIPSYYNEADVFIFPSLFEGSALVVYEALASGLPVITTPNSGSIVRNNIDGFIIPIRDIDAIKEKILLLYNNKILRQKMAKSAREQAEKYSWEAYRKKVADFVKKIS